MRRLIKKILKEEDDLGWAQETVTSGEIRPTRSLLIKRQTKNLKNAIETHTEVMHGDGDSYDKNTVIYYKDGKGKWKNDDYRAEFNFNDFEIVISFLKDEFQIDWEDDEQTEFFKDAGVIDYDEYADNGYETGSINNAWYYDDMGNKYDARIDGLSTYGDDEEDYDEDEEDYDEDDDELCEYCGDYDDTGTGVCSDCDDDDLDDEEEDDED